MDKPVALYSTNSIDKMIQVVVGGNGPIFVSRPIQPTYNLKAHYLPILQKCSFHKLCVYSEL